MNEGKRIFLLDSNVLITAYRSYYAFDLCPGFWGSIKKGHAEGRIFSTQRVMTELGKGDALDQWVADELPDGFFLDDATTEVAAEFAPMMSWVQSRDFLPAAKGKFAGDADGWLVATAKEKAYCVVTHEARQDGAKARVMMPNLCEEFGVNYCNTFEMLRELGCSFT
jgi:hypothetical protein